MCHPEERSDEGVSIIGGGISSLLDQLRGLDIIPSKLPQENIKRGDPSQKAFGTKLRVGSERGQFPLSTKIRRFLATLEMTINGGGQCPPPTPPKNDFMPLGEVRRGSFNPFD